MKNNRKPRAVLTATCLLLAPVIAMAAGRPPVPTLRCAGTIGIDFPRPAYSDSYAVNKFRDEIIFTYKSLHGFESHEPEDSVPIGDDNHLITLPK